VEKNWNMPPPSLVGESRRLTWLHVSTGIRIPALGCNLQTAVLGSWEHCEIYFCKAESWTIFTCYWVTFGGRLLFLL
jgi:hypothetical protein